MQNLQQDVMVLYLVDLESVDSEVHSAVSAPVATVGYGDPLPEVPSPVPAVYSEGHRGTAAG
jgi:hypothetical protein